MPGPYYNITHNIRVNGTELTVHLKGSYSNIVPKDATCGFCQENKATGMNVYTIIEINGEPGKEISQKLRKKTERIILQELADQVPCCPNCEIPKKLTRDEFE